MWCKNFREKKCFHVPIEPNSRKYTAFITHNGVYEFLYVPFGISNSPAVLCRYITSVLRDLINDGTLLIYMDDIIITSENKEEGNAKLRRVLEVVKMNGLDIKWSKCQFLKKKINFFWIYNRKLYDKTFRGKNQNRILISVAT